MILIKEKINFKITQGETPDIDGVKKINDFEYQLPSGTYIATLIEGAGKAKGGSIIVETLLEKDETNEPIWIVDSGTQHNGFKQTITLIENQNIVRLTMNSTVQYEKIN